MSAQRLRAGGRARARRARNRAAESVRARATPSHEPTSCSIRARDILHPCRSTSVSATCRANGTSSFATNGILLTEEVMGFEGFSGLESILYHLHSPCRVIECRRVRADRARGVGARRARAPAPPKTWDVAPGGDAVSGRRLLMWNDDVEISLCAADRGDGSLLPERRGRRGDLRPRGQRHARDDLRRPAVRARRLHRRSRAARPTASAPRASSATSSSRPRG